jgi:1-acyl-sn-glycerol-3-phosphate acyltransferase
MDKSRFVNPSPFEYWFYQFAQSLVAGFNKIYWSTEVAFESELPDPPYILAPTHRSNIDTLIIGSITSDPMVYMAKAGVFKYRPVAKLLRLLGGFPVERGGSDREAMGIALSALSAGYPLVIYPEGTRRSGLRVDQIEEGAAYLSLKANVPIVPAAIAGSDRAMPKGAKLLYPAKIAVEVGAALSPALVREKPETRLRRSQINSYSDCLQAELDRLLQKAERSRALLARC